MHWQTIEPNTPFTQTSLHETLHGGQAFRWTPLPAEQAHLGIWSTHVVKIRLQNQSLQAQSLTTQTTPEDIRQYLASSTHWAKLADDLPWRSDSHLANCIDNFRGLRLLKQPFAETVLAFLCSATKQIPQIKVMCENMAREIGAPISDRIHSLPTWEQLSECTETQLRKLSLGFRAKNIKKTADILAADPSLLPQIEAATYPEAKAALCELPGIGEKIADCALLFGTAKYEAFPVDTWIIKTLERRYKATGWSNPQLAHFGRIHFGSHAGYAQQFLFSHERASPKDQ
ncbi:MAG: DNA glycosylase [Verrucomicrobiota bacterium]